MSGNFAIKDNELYGDTALIRRLSTVGYVVSHLGWGDFTCSNGERNFDFFRFSDTKQFHEQEGRAHHIRCYLNNVRTRDMESVTKALQELGATKRDFLLTPEEVHSEMRVRLK